MENSVKEEIIAGILNDYFDDHKTNAETLLQEVQMANYLIYRILKSTNIQQCLNLLIKSIGYKQYRPDISLIAILYCIVSTLKNVNSRST